jgi:HAD superfamily hydrolase (TIGR01662 family)
MNADFLKNIDTSWTLFLDRDGVLNHEIAGDYVRNIAQLDLYTYVPKALAKCNNIFGKIIVVTNQRGIGKGLYTTQDVHNIHTHLNGLCHNTIDAFYHSPALDKSHSSRKPNIGMALEAQQHFTEINFSKSIMVGNNISDMQFGKNAGMHTVFVQTTSTNAQPNAFIDILVQDLEAFVAML